MKILRITWYWHDVVEDCPDLMAGQPCPGHMVEDSIDRVEYCEVCDSPIPSALAG